MERTERPFLLSIAAAVFFISGVIACVAMFTGKGIDILAIGSLLVAFGILTRKGWALAMLQIAAVFHVIAASLVTLSFFLPLNGTGKATISFHQIQWEVSPVLVTVLFVLIALFYAYVAFLDNSKKYFART